MRIFRVALTGGPCSGKSTSIKYIRAKLGKKYRLIFINEAATELINSGISPKTVGDVEFQRCIIELQLKKEKIAIEAAEHFSDTDTVVLIYDRGIPDGQAYVGEEIFKKLLNIYKETLESVHDRYDAVIHLTTAADGAVDKYQWSGSGKKCNNCARTETPQEAIIKDRKTLEAWEHHPNLHVLDNSCSFKTKMANVVDIIQALIAEEF